MAWLWRAPVDFALKAAGLIIAAALATPYSLDYDMTALAPAIAFLAVHGMRCGFAPYEKSALAAVWIAPLVARSLAQTMLLPAASRDGNRLRILPREKSFRRVAGTSWGIRSASDRRLVDAPAPALHASHCRSAKSHCGLFRCDDFSVAHCAKTRSFCRDLSTLEFVQASLVICAATLVA
jgi:hypothetical protein